MRRGLRWAARAAVSVAVLLVLYVGVTFVQVWRAANRDAAQSAQAIVVLGAAQYDGRPSPVLQSRLDHALRLYADGLAPVVVVTGGRRPGDRVREANAADLYLQRRGVPREALRLETGGRSSWESLAAAARFLREEDIEEVLLVSDPWHSYRIGAIAEEVGLTAYVSPTGTGVYSERAKARQLVRETVAVSLGRLLGYRRLQNLERFLGPAPREAPEVTATGSAAPR
ncbi:YdcF family protein [soil metagenome]